MSVSRVGRLNRPLPADVDVALRELVRVLAALLDSPAVSRQGTTQEGAGK